MPSGKERSGLEPGLYLVPTPLGNLGDLSPRVDSVLRASDLIAAEDTRRSLRLLSHLGISAPMLSYREDNHLRAWPRIRDSLSKGKVVSLLTDAGAPLVSDPGSLLVGEAAALGYRVFPIPGPSAVTTALMASGFRAGSFTFAGFPPAKPGKRRAYLESLAALPHPLVFFEAPHRLGESLASMLEAFGDRRALLAREMTKIHEEYLRDSLASILESVTVNPRKGESTIVVEGLKPKGGAAASDGNWGDGMGDPEEDGLASQGAAQGAAQGDPDPLGALRAAKDEILADPRPAAQLAKDWAARLGIPRKLAYSVIAGLRDGG
ncbi:MAG: 16S rRNA (cytidine(1402)-2'-O)-methyltransferase [Deltaproteobacteria bacterium]|jgi:16S rRNA (cytidine1402-2'-O)-methyltransferase|nr:16S rRNA (cytidine(1402)-2'-O)-methyltransferase [Deltaproteobacteria bacterium]